MWNEVTFWWNELTILWNDLTIDWNDLTIERKQEGRRVEAPHLKFRKGHT